MNKNIEDIEESRQTDNKDYLPRLVSQLEELMDQDINIPFHIKDIRDNGFIIKVCGLFAFLSFDHMAWIYDNKESWKAVLKSLKGKQFYGKVYKLIKDPQLILFNAQIPQFKEAVLSKGEKYNGIVINKNKRGLVIDIGSHFRWKSGSIVGFLHESQLPRNHDMSDFNKGDKINTTYFGINDKDQMIFCNDIYQMDWYKIKPKHLDSEIVKAKIIKINQKGEVKLLVAEKYIGILQSIKQGYPARFHEKVKKEKEKLKEGDVITCEVIELNDRRKQLILRWLLEFDTELVLENSILNKLDEKTISKLTSISVD